MVSANNVLPLPVDRSTKYCFSPIRRHREHHHCVSVCSDCLQQKALSLVFLTNHVVIQMLMNFMGFWQRIFAFGRNFFNFFTNNIFQNRHIRTDMTEGQTINLRTSC